MAVFLRWLLVDLIVIRVLRRHRLRRYRDDSYPVLSAPYTRFGRRTYGPAPGNYRYGRRRRLSGCSGCLVLIAAMTLGIVLLVALMHWIF
ncbi:MAG: hypothetical protein QOE18_264 [Chloroflexota bacterium]|nr:hypothetical protein [Chloroflexota bacterium]